MTVSLKGWLVQPTWHRSNFIHEVSLCSTWFWREIQKKIVIKRPSQKEATKGNPNPT